MEIEEFNKFEGKYTSWSTEDLIKAATERVTNTYGKFEDFQSSETMDNIKEKG
jgi:hypothetical protein